MGRKKLLICQEQENGSTVRNRRAIGLSRKGGTREPSVCQEGQPLVYQKQENCWCARNRKTVILSGTAKQLVNQEQESCWFVRSRRSVGLSGQESCYSVYLLVSQEQCSCLPTKNIRAVGLVGIGELLVCQDRITAGLSGTVEVLVSQKQERWWSVVDRSFFVGFFGIGCFWSASDRSFGSLSGTRA